MEVMDEKTSVLPKAPAKGLDRQHMVKGAEKRGVSTSLNAYRCVEDGFGVKH